MQGFRKAGPMRKLAILRHLKGWTQVELAEEAGVRQADMCCAETRFNKCRMEVLEKIAEALDITVRELLPE